MRGIPAGVESGPVGREGTKLLGFTRRASRWGPGHVHVHADGPLGLRLRVGRVLHTELVPPGPGPTGEWDGGMPWRMGSPPPTSHAPGDLEIRRFGPGEMMGEGIPLAEAGEGQVGRPPAPDPGGPGRCSRCWPGGTGSRRGRLGARATATGSGRPGRRSPPTPWPRRPAGRPTGPKGGGVGHR